jgi:hypothetical protein
MTCCRSPSGLRELRREPLDPPVDAHVIYLYATFRQELLDVSVGKPNRRYQRTAKVMTSGGKRYPAKAELGAGRTGGRWRDLIELVSLMPMPAANATVPPGPF